ncbi:MAG: hypothetical protein WC882_05910 [Candidatus Gracilibacteria bacterium]
MKKFLIFVFCFFTIAGCAEISEELSFYENETLGVTLEYPSDWILEKDWTEETDALWLPLDYDAVKNQGNYEVLPLITIASHPLNNQTFEKSLIQENQWGGYSTLDEVPFFQEETSESTYEYRDIGGNHFLELFEPSMLPNRTYYFERDADFLSFNTISWEEDSRVISVLESLTFEPLIKESLKGEVSLTAPACVRISNQDFFTEENVRVALDSFHEYSLKEISALFQNTEFQALKAKSEYSSLCLWYNAAAFAFYGDYGEFNNVVGLNTREGFVTSYQFIKNSGDIGACTMVGYLDGVIYECAGGDGPFSFKKEFLLMPEGETKTIQDCEYSGGYSDGTVEYESSVECTVDLLESARLF